MFLTGIIFQPPQLRAELVFTGNGIGTSGEAISGSATFDFVFHDFGGGDVNALKITLTNTATTTSQRGNLITGVFFSLSGGVGNLSTDDTGFDGLAATVQTTTGGATSSNVDIATAVNNTATDGTYQLSNGPFGIANSGNSYSAFDYGIATVGMGLTGFNGAAVNGDDYGVFANGSDLTQDGLPSALPLIDTSAMFWIARPIGLTDLSQLGDSVRITYGSLPDNFFTATAVPEPTSLLMFATLIGVASGRRRRVQNR